MSFFSLRKTKYLNLTKNINQVVCPRNFISFVRWLFSASCPSSTQTSDTVFPLFSLDSPSHQLSVFFLSVCRSDSIVQRSGVTNRLPQSSQQLCESLQRHVYKPCLDGGYKQACNHNGSTPSCTNSRGRCYKQRRVFD